jgi:uncharacterized protein YbjT (DUF2867 family)
MNVLVCGASGCVGSAVASALRSRGHRVIEGGRTQGESRLSTHVDFMQARPPSAWAAALAQRRVEVIVNCVGILIESRAQSFERVHSAGPIEMFRGAALAGVGRVIQVSALGVGADPQSLATPYLHSKLRADDALAGLGVDWAVLRPSLVYGPGSASAELFATLASLPVIGLPGRGEQQVQPVHVYEVAEAVARLVEHPGALRAVHEIGGAASLSYREMLATYRAALGLGPALWLRMPMPLMALGARVAEWLPQKVFSRDTLRLLERGSVPGVNSAAVLLGREPTSLARGLQTTPPTLMFDLRVELPTSVSTLLRALLALMWIYTALISAVFQDQSGVMNLLARCGLTGIAGQIALIASCTLNLGLGVSLWLRPSPWAFAVQVGAVLGYTLTAAIHMPELLLDHCGPLVKNLPVLGLVLLLWLAHGTGRQGAASQARRAVQDLTGKAPSSLHLRRSTPA